MIQRMIPRADLATPSTLRAEARGSVWTVVFAMGLLVAFVGFIALGIWQWQRMGWKDALIARVEARVHADPVPPPPRSRWPEITAQSDEYRRVRLSGRFLAVPETRTQAVTTLGAGWWLLAPFRTDDGEIVLVNRGFVPTGEGAAPPPTGAVAIEGLLRISEPKGGFLRSNDPGQDRWYSRDVGAIASARGLNGEAVAPFFVDAARDPGGQGWPRGGLTVVQFRDHHLSYALTWFGMALLTAIAGLRLLVSIPRLRQDRRERRGFEPCRIHPT
jgi:surfeit locus 1 family protein